MVDLLRLDERLIHGQVATSWIKAKTFDTLLVIDDESAKDQFLSKTLYMAAPKGVKTFVMTNEEALNVLNDPRCKTRHVFVVVRSLDTLYNICKNAVDVEEVTLSNYGRMVPSDKERTQYTGHMFLDEDEVAKVKEVLDLGIPTYMQMIPSDPKKPASELFK
ncbi:MAG: PTS sugar transporter subunit IIB [Erysipelotrichaceae bacterium]|nr:PTS sugar transporter subunit IIB [Erysipelotrichaceae bacterium]